MSVLSGLRKLYHVFRMAQHRTLLKKNDLFRKTGSVNIFISNGPAEDISTNPFTRFKVTRGFIDDLNRLLPLRMRIHIEVEIGRGKQSGEAENSQTHIRWEFQEYPMLG